MEDKAKTEPLAPLLLPLLRFQRRFGEPVAHLLLLMGLVMSLRKEIYLNYAAH